MPRLILLEQECYEFHYDVTIQLRNENSHGHVDHKAIVEILHDARGNILRSLGLSEKDLGDGGTGDVMADLAVNYKKESFAFDRLRVDTHFGEIGPKSFRMFYRVRKIKDDSVVALAEAGFVSYDYTKSKAAPLPQAFVKAVSSPKG